MPVDERPTASYDSFVMSVEQLSTRNSAAANSRKLAGAKPLRESRIERDGLKPGTVAPDFAMPDINGRSISLQQYRGRRVVLVFSDPHCGPCSQLAPYLTRMYRRRGAITTEIVVISRGEIEENRRKAEAYGFEFPVVVQDRWKLSRKYGIFATPVAFLIGEDGRTQREVATGFEQIRNLLRNEFGLNAIERFKETIEDISGVLSSPLPRRHAFRVAALMAAGAFLSTIGIPETALAACSAGTTACGSACCNDGSEICCNAGTSTCCSASLVCCNGRCCAPGQVCLFGSCRQQIQP
jgi:peroxiredoxin